MLPFTAEEFDIMVAELLSNEEVSFDMLCAIAKKTLYSSIKRWCQADPLLVGMELEDDIFQDVCVRLMKKTVAFYLLREGIDGPVNRDMEGFKNWMFCVAKNIKRDYADFVRQQMHFNQGLEENQPVLVNSSMVTFERPSAERERLLSYAFSIVLNADVQVYKILTWVAQCLYMLEHNITKIAATTDMVECFSQKTLFEMRDMLFQWAEQIPWLHITQAQRDKIEAQLQVKSSDGKSYGEMCYSAFFMKKGGKATISDWVNRMNHLIHRVVKNGTFDD